MQPAAGQGARQSTAPESRRNKCAENCAPNCARTDEEDDRARRDELREVLADRGEAGERADGAELDGARVAARGAEHLREGVALRGEDGDHRHLAQPRERLQRVELQRALRGDVADDRPEQPLVDDPHLVRLGLGDLGEHVHRVLLERLVAREQRRHQQRQAVVLRDLRAVLRLAREDRERLRRLRPHHRVDRVDAARQRLQPALLDDLPRDQRRLRQLLRLAQHVQLAREPALVGQLRRRVQLVDERRRRGAHRGRCCRQAAVAAGRKLPKTAETSRRAPASDTGRAVLVLVP